MKTKINRIYFSFSLSVQEEFAPYRGSSTGVVARRRTEPVEVIESLRGRMGESARQASG